jgi:hypothetical protein
VPVLGVGQRSKDLADPKTGEDEALALIENSQEVRLKLFGSGGMLVQLA